MWTVMDGQYAWQCAEEDCNINGVWTYNKETRCGYVKLMAM